MAGIVLQKVKYPLRFLPVNLPFLKALTQTPGNLHLIRKNAPHTTIKAPRIMMKNKALHMM